MYRAFQCAELLHRATIQLQLLLMCIFCSRDLLQHHLLQMLACRCGQGPLLIQSPPKRYAHAQGQKGVPPAIQEPQTSLHKTCDTGRQRPQLAFTWTATAGLRAE